MASLIIRYTEGSPLTRSVNIDNCRAFGYLNNKSLYIITDDLSGYSIENLTIKKFLETIKLGLDLPVIGRYIHSSLSCYKCYGRGTTDWVTRIVGKKNPSKYLDDEKFIVDKTAPFFLFNTFMSIEDKKVTLYISRVKLEDHLEYCDVCGGTGLFMFSALMDEVPVGEISTCELNF